MIDNSNFSSQDNSISDITIPMMSSLNYVPVNEYFWVMIIMSVVCGFLLLASAVASMIYMKNKRKLGEFLTYKQPASSMQQSKFTQGTASFGPDKPS